MDNTRSPMENLFNVLSSFSAGNDKALKQGLYNAVALFLLGVVCIAGYALYIVLNPFAKPLLWALLCGSVLFPFKYSLTTNVQSWFDGIEMSSKSFAINLLLLPFKTIDETSESLGSFLKRHVKYIVGALITATFLLNVYYYTPSILTCLSWRIILFFGGIVNLFVWICNIYTVTVLSIGYLSILYVYWTPENSANFRITSFALWFIVSLYLSNYLGAYQVIAFVTAQFLYLIGFGYEAMLLMETQESQGKHTTFIEAMYRVLNGNCISEAQECRTDESLKKADSADSAKESTSVEEEKHLSEHRVDDIITARCSSATTKLDKKSISLDTDFCRNLTACVDPTSMRKSSHKRHLLRRLKSELRISSDVEDSDTAVDADKYIYGVLYGCIGMIIWKHKWIVRIFVIPIAYYLIKKIGASCGFWDALHSHSKSLVEMIQSWCLQRHEALLPANVTGLYKIFIIIDRRIAKALKESVDAVATTAVILVLLIFLVCTSTFITIQVYAEGMHLIQVTGEIVNSTLMNNPDIDWVPETWEESINSLLDNAYTYGRGAISDGVKGLMRDLDKSKAEQMEKKILELWDRLYQAWMMSDEKSELIGPTVDVTAAYSVWESLKDSFIKTPPLQFFNVDTIKNLMKENVGVLMSVLDSVWSIVKGNMSVILTIFTEFFYIILMSGSAVLNFTLSTIVFFTTLFYLLSSSEKTYKPVEMMTAVSPISCHKFVIALQEAVIGVFAATIKIATFFGMWTWLVHNLFQVKITYLPATFATMLGAVPFLDAYVACIPATIELWFTRGSVTAILFFFFHFLPCNIIVTEFYKEIKGGGHPYLTGLSIAGGIFCLGFEGAILGPLLLCCIMVAIDLGRRYMRSPSEEPMNRFPRVTAN